MNIVLFLGAGFSRAWNLPVMREFFPMVNEASFLPEDDKHFVMELRRRARSGESMMQIPQVNLEGVLSFCLADANTGELGEDKSDYDRLCNILGRVYSHVDLSTLSFESGPCERVEKLFRGNFFQNNKFKLTILTTNYDVLLEWTMARLGYPCSLPETLRKYDRPATDIATSSCLYSSNGPLICKLHGSVNWYRTTTNGDTYIVEDRVATGQYVDDKFARKQVSLPAVSWSGYEAPSTPLIVPPTLYKHQPDQIIRDTWSAAGEALKEADILTFIGFSFPDSDTYMKYFFASNLVENHTLRAIEIIDPQADEIVSRLKESMMGNHFKDWLRPIAHKWHDLGLDLSERYG